MNLSLTVVLRSLVMAIALLAIPAGAAQGAQKPIDLVVSDQVASGSLKRTADGRLKLRLQTGPERLGLRSVGRTGMPGKELIAYRQKLPSYFSTWRETFGGEGRRAVLIDPGKGGGRVQSLKLSRPRFSRKTGVATFEARRAGRPRGVLAGFANRSTGVSPGTFDFVKVKIHDNGWYSFWAHLNAYGDGHGCSGSYEGPDFSCQAAGETTNTSPWKGYGFFGSTEGGAKFYMNGHITVPWDRAQDITMKANLKGTQAPGWRSDRLTITDESRYRSFLGNYAICTRVPVSGNDTSLTASPGGPLRVTLNSASSWTSHSYVLDVSGFLSEGFPIEKQCR